VAILLGNFPPIPEDWSKIIENILQQFQKIGVK
jgi:hypothetical protein